ncbi:MAG: ATP-binding protein [Pseudomonadota bacterium]
MSGPNQLIAERRPDLRFGPTPVWLMFSGGKDSVAALIELQRSDQFELVGLITTYNQANRRIALHGTPLTLLEDQAAAFGLPLESIALPPACSNADYEVRVANHLNGLKEYADPLIAFGDLFLQDIRDYRVRQCAAMGWRPLFPLWGRPTRTFAMDLITAGVRAIICCVDLQCLDASMLGREWDQACLDDLPEGVDPAGEHGEFHTLVIDAPGMRAPLTWHSTGQQFIAHQRYCMLDLQPARA